MHYTERYAYSNINHHRSLRPELAAIRKENREMKEKDITYTYVWSINKKMVVARSIKQAIDIYCVQFDALEEEIQSIDRMDSYGDAAALIVDHDKQEEAQP